MYARRKLQTNECEVEEDMGIVCELKQISLETFEVLRQEPSNSRIGFRVVGFVSRTI